MQSVTVNYKELDVGKHWHWLWQQLGRLEALLFSILALLFLTPLLLVNAWQGQWLGFSASLACLSYFSYLIIVRSRESRLKEFRAYPTTTFTLFPESIQIDSEHGISRRAWTAIEKLTALDDGLIIQFRDHGSEVIFYVPSSAFASHAEYVAWHTQAQAWHQRATIERHPFKSIELSLSERYRIQFDLTYEELSLDRAATQLVHSYQPPQSYLTQTELAQSRRRRKILLGTTLAAWIFTIYDPTSSQPAQPFLNFGLTILSVALLVSSVLILAKISQRLERAKFQSELPVTVIFADEGFRTIRPDFEHFQSWKDVDVLFVHQERLLLWRGCNNCGNFPKRVFASPQEASEVERWIQSKIPQRPPKLIIDEYAEYPEQTEIKDDHNPYQSPQH